jgi:uncharacterized protein YjlB
MRTSDEIKRGAGTKAARLRPTIGAVRAPLREDEPHAFHFHDDGLIPNHPTWPLLLYRAALRFSIELDPAAALEELFGWNGWGRSWHNGVYPFPHYHSQIHEALGVARGSAEVLFGGDGGRSFHLTPGDVAVLPAGTGHQCLSSTPDFLIVGTYPREGVYDLCRRPENRLRALATISNVPRPHADPVYGGEGRLLSMWK